jgi:hypothetical protein
MGIFITNFETTAELATFSATTDFGRPHVSLTKDDSKVHYFDDPYNGHPYVEIGGLKWATMNVGANSITDYGLYFQWGDTQGYTASQVGYGEGQKAFTWADYKFNPSGDGETFTKYNATDGKTVLDIEDDAARANWGGQWRMPTTAEIQDLVDAVTTAWTQVDGVYGMLYTDKTDSSKTLFFPPGGAAGDGAIGYPNGGYVWGNSLNSGNVDSPGCLGFGSGGSGSDLGIRYGGFSVRGVVG